MVVKRKSQDQNGAGIKDIIRYVKNNRLISRGLGLIPHPNAQLASRVASMVGLGQKKRAPRKKRATKKPPVQMGHGIFGDLGSGLGNLATGIGRGLFGSGAKKRKPKNDLIKIK